ncbi:MAG: hypothetical protein KIT14_22735 [bacterium]|nr:hypothetical protein [bacterium]
MTARFEEASLAQVVAAIAGAVGAEVRGGVASPRSVTAAFDAVPLQEVFERVMGGESFTLIYQGNALRTIRLVGEPPAAPTTVAVAVPPPPRVHVAPSTAALSQALNRYPAVPVHGRLAMTLRADQATFSQLAGVATRERDPEVRAEAVDAGLAAIERDPHLRELALGTLRDLDGASLAALAEGLLGDPAAEIVRRVLARTANAELRQRAAAALAALPAPASSDAEAE